MYHYIIVKFNEDINKRELTEPIRGLLKKALNIQDIEAVDIFESNMDLPNRYDLMIRMKLTLEGLKEFDNGEIHKEWKEKFGKYINNKTIFDCE